MFDVATGVLLLVGGALGVIPVDARAAWACVLAAGIVLVVGRIFH